MKAKNLAITLTLIIVLLFIFVFIDQREKARRKDEIIDRLTYENRMLKLGYFRLLEKSLKENNAEPQIIEELKRLKSKIDKMDTRTHVELDFIIKMVTNGEGIKAVKDLAKIIENILKEEVKKDTSFKGKPMLHNLLKHAKDKQLICSRLFENGIKLKELRNKESHELAPKITKLEIGISIFSGIEIIYTLNFFRTLSKIDSEPK